MFIVSATLISIPRVDAVFQRSVPRVLGTLGMSPEVMHHLMKVLVVFHESLFRNHLGKYFRIRLVLGRKSLAPLFFTDSIHLLFHSAFEGVRVLLRVLCCVELIRKCFERPSLFANL